MLFAEIVLESHFVTFCDTMDHFPVSGRRAAVCMYEQHTMEHAPRGHDDSRLWHPRLFIVPG